MLNMDLSGRTFGHWTVLHRSIRYLYWDCRCVCGVEHAVKVYELLQGNSKSCGCRRGDTLRTHGESVKESVEYRIWANMLHRCNNPNHPKYDRYGGRGITVCSQWYGFEAFLADMGRRPSKDYSIERKDNNAGYTPENCTWATRKEQMVNQQRTIRVTVKGITRTLGEWSELTGIKKSVLYWQHRKGDSDAALGSLIEGAIMV